MIKHQNKIIAQKALGMRAKNINRELSSTVAKQEARLEKLLASAGQRTRSLNCDFERAGIANPEGE